jgi:hypothetical protein
MKLHSRRPVQVRAGSQRVLTAHALTSCGRRLRSGGSGRRAMWSACCGQRAARQHLAQRGAPFALAERSLTSLPGVEGGTNDPRQAAGRSVVFSRRTIGPAPGPCAPGPRALRGLRNHLRCSTYWNHRIARAAPGTPTRFRRSLEPDDNEARMIGGSRLQSIHSDELGRIAAVRCACGTRTQSARREHAEVACRRTFERGS